MKQSLQDKGLKGSYALSTGRTEVVSHRVTTVTGKLGGPRGVTKEETVGNLDPEKQARLLAVE